MVEVSFKGPFDYYRLLRKMVEYGKFRETKNSISSNLFLRTNRCKIFSQFSSKYLAGGGICVFKGKIACKQELNFRMGGGGGECKSSRIIVK